MVNSSDIPAIRKAWNQADHDKKIQWIVKADIGSGGGYYATLDWKTFSNGGSGQDAGAFLKIIEVIDQELKGN